MTLKEYVMSKEFEEIYISMPKEIRDIVRHQIPRCGSGGAGNHFLEFQKDNNCNIWFMIHSGSRKLGHFIAEYYNNKAIELNKLWHTSVDSKNKLAFLPIDSEEGKNYIKYMDFACKIAEHNHQIMSKKTKKSIIKIFPSCEFIEEHYVRHNYARMENHFGSNVMVHRKGATSARLGEIGIIPGSQGTKSYIVKGKGNAESFCSCSHGAGRKMSRTRAQKELNLEEEQEKLNSQGILHAIRSTGDLDEAAGAYKDIQEVMANQSDLVEIVTELSPLAVIKG